MSAIVIVDASKYIDSVVQFRTNPPGAILTLDTVTPQCVISVASVDGSPLWSNTTQDMWWKKSPEGKLPAGGTRDPPETPPDWGGIDDVVMGGDEGPADAQPVSVPDDPMISSSAQGTKGPGCVSAKSAVPKGPHRPRSHLQITRMPLRAGSSGRGTPALARRQKKQRRRDAWRTSCHSC